MCSKIWLGRKLVYGNEYSTAEHPQITLIEVRGRCLGGLSANRDIDVGYTMAAAKAFTDFLAPRLDDGKKFRFVYTSGLSAVRDPKKSLWVMPAMRHVRVCDRLSASPTTLLEAYLIGNPG